MESGLRERKKQESVKMGTKIACIVSEKKFNHISFMIQLRKEQL